MNNIILTGNLTQDINDSNSRASYGTMQSGRTFYNNGIAVNAGYYDKNNTWVDRTYFFNIRAYAGVADNFAKNFFKGDGILVQGEMVAEPYENEGKKGVNYYVLVNRVERSSRKNPHTQDNGMGQPVAQSVSQYNQSQAPQGYANGFIGQTQNVQPPVQNVAQNVAQPATPNVAQNTVEDFAQFDDMPFA